MALARSTADLLLAALDVLASPDDCARAARALDSGSKVYIRTCGNREHSKRSVRVLPGKPGLAPRIYCHACGGESWSASKLATVAGIDATSYGRERKRRAPVPPKPRGPVLDAAKMWKGLRAGADGGEALRYLVKRWSSRKLAEAAIDAGAIGFDPRAIDYALRFPLYEATAKSWAPVSFMRRRLVDVADDGAKSKRASNDSMGLSDGTHVLLGDAASKAVATDARLYVAEGDIDAALLMALREQDYIHGGVVGLPGNSEKALAKLARLARSAGLVREVVVCTDPDRAGAKYLVDACNAFKGFTVLRPAFPRGMDLTDILHADGGDPTRLLAYLDQAHEPFRRIEAGAGAHANVLEEQGRKLAELLRGAIVELAQTPVAERPDSPIIVTTPPGLGKSHVAVAVISEMDLAGLDAHLALGYPTRALTHEKYLELKANGQDPYLLPTTFDDCDKPWRLPARAKQVHVTCGGCPKFECPVRERPRVAAASRLVIGTIEALRRAREIGYLHESVVYISDDPGGYESTEAVTLEHIDTLRDEPAVRGFDFLKNAEFNAAMNAIAAVMSNGDAWQSAFTSQERARWLAAVNTALASWPEDKHFPDAEAADAGHWDNHPSWTALCAIRTALSTPNSGTIDKQTLRVTGWSSAWTAGGLVLDATVAHDVAMIGSGGTARIISVDAPMHPETRLYAKATQNATHKTWGCHPERAVRAVAHDLAQVSRRYGLKANAKIGIVGPAVGEAKDHKGQYTGFLRADLADVFRDRLRELGLADLVADSYPYLHHGNTRSKNDLEGCDVVAAYQTAINLDALKAGARALEVSAEVYTHARADAEAVQAIGRARAVRHARTVLFYHNRYTAPPAVGAVWKPIPSVVIDETLAAAARGFGLLTSNVDIWDAYVEVAPQVIDDKGFRTLRSLRDSLWAKCPNPYKINGLQTDLYISDRRQERRDVARLRAAGFDVLTYDLPRAAVYGAGTGGRPFAVSVIRDSEAHRILDALLARPPKAAPEPELAAVVPMVRGTVTRGLAALGLPDNEMRGHDWHEEPTPMKHHNDSPAPIGTFGFVTPDTRTDDAEPPSPRTVELCKQWLASSWPQRVTDSYALKHLVEQWCGEYIPNGALLAAAIELDIPVQRDSGQNGRLVPGLLMAG